MRTFILSLFTACFFAVIAMPASAADTIAIVNLKKILKESKATQSIQKQIEDRKKKIQSEISSTEEKLVKEDKELATQRSVMAQEAFEKKVKDFQKEVVDAQRDVQQRRTKLEESYAKALSKVEDVVTKIIEEMAKEKGFTVAIPRAQVLYSSGSLDISDEVLKRLNDRLPDVKVEMK